MATLPAYVEILVDGYSEDSDPAIERTDFERGFAKQRVKNTFVTAKLAVKFLIRGKENVAAFDSWYYDELKRIGFFDMRHPRTGAIISVRFVEAKIGPLEMIRPNFAAVTRSCVVEYIRQ